ncbi:hypothetical protein [Acinetobacter ursingii]|uniref:hypothetical protein n=1 Tax=Acinetobacter ursingii TaxID=108980 RepID=UPI0021E28902|nr:hypothetical protein [Acinetobacter ursingii]UYF80098.1 hypothetical protein LSO59_06105 [Acinetobacter ursingii]
MSDNFEHDKPYSLTAHYLEDAEPSQLTVSYDLHAKFLGVPDTELPVTQYINTLSFLSQEFGIGNLVFTQHVRTTGFGSLNIPNPKIHNLTQSIRATGLNASLFGTAQLKNKNQTSGAAGFNASLYGRPTIYNLRQYLRFGGMHTAVFGTAYMQGGVKEVGGSGFNSAAVPQPKVINTRADQYVDLRTPSGGIAPPTIDRPNVSPRILYPMGILPGAFGTAWVQRNPSPKGFTTDSYGNAWVSHSPRYLTPFKVEAFLSGYAKVFDPKQRIYHEGSPHIPGGIFGDIAIKNTRRIISVPGSNQSLYGDWSEVRSNLSTAGVQSFDAAVFGNNTIWNKTPSVIPGAWDSNAFGQALIADRIRRVNARGIDWPESQRFGKHILTKPPEINLRGFSPMVFGQPFISNKVREVFAGADNHLRMGTDLVVWFRYRYVELESKGIYSQAFASPKIEHGVRDLLAKGSDFSAIGRPTTWFKIRSITVTGIGDTFSSNHRVGGTQFVKPSGYVASLFGERIVPENQGIYGTGFNAQGFTENHRIELHTRWVRATGFLTFGIQTSDRYGTASVWNKRQYIQHNYDSGDGLNPGAFGQWTAIANRNRVIGAQGFTATRYGYSAIDNNARLLKPEAMLMTVFGKPMIADRVRYLRLEGMEAPYMSGWGRVHNSAFVIAPVSGRHDQWGNAALVNTRRQYRWVGAFDSMVFGQPMIAFRIRKLSLESRYSIYQPSMPLPKVDLYTRYIDPPGPDLSAFGGPSLYIKWNTFTPRWTHRDYFGEPRVHNVTPELKQRGNSTDVFGQAGVRLQKQYYGLDGFGTELWGRHHIAYRDRSISVPGTNTFGMGKILVTKTGAPPYSEQRITLDWPGEGERPDDFEGNGIAPLRDHVGRPSLKTNVVFASGFMASTYGGHHLQSNGILLDAGIQEFAIGDHFIGLKNRTIQVPTLGDFGTGIEETRPSVSPHTIYAVMEAPAQAIKNHYKHGRLHYVNSDSGNRAPGEVFGNARVTLRHRQIYLHGYNYVQGNVGTHSLQLRKRYVRPTGINMFRMGWHYCSDGSPQNIEQYDSENTQAFGHPSVVAPYYGPQHIGAGRLNANVFGENRVEHFHRTVRAVGSNMLLMGTGRSGDTPYKPQGLWVGEPKPTIPQGFNAEVFGSTTISLRVRDVSVIGFDSFSSEIDISNFKGRMKVTLVKKPVVIEPKEIELQSFGDTAYGTPDIRLKVHYIRPDGNSDQYRKGGPT